TLTLSYSTLFRTRISGFTLKVGLDCDIDHVFFLKSVDLQIDSPAVCGDRNVRYPEVSQVEFRAAISRCPFVTPLLDEKIGRRQRLSCVYRFRQLDLKTAGLRPDCEHFKCGLPVELEFL